MSTVDPSANILQQVITYNKSNLAILQNMCPFVSTFNGKFKNFNEDVPKNLGDTVSFDLPPRFTTTDTLVASFQAASQRVQNLSVNNAKNISYSFTAQQFIFQVEEYMDVFGKSAMAQLGTTVDAKVAAQCETAPYRFYGDGINPINSYTLVAQALAAFRNYGAASGDAKVYFSDTMIPSIIGNGLGQFVPKRNDDIANSWELGSFDRAEYYVSNLLPVHISGAAGNGAWVAPITAISGDGTQLTITDTAHESITNYVLQFDSGQITDSSGNPLKFLTYVGYIPSSQNVQFQVTANANSSAGGVVVLNVNPPLIFDSTGVNSAANLNKAIATDGTMTVKFLPSHRCGIIIGGNAGYVAMPKLPQEVPFPTAVETDELTGISLRTYYGSLFGQNQRGMIHDVIWGSTIVPEYSMKIAIPLTV